MYYLLTESFKSQEATLVTMITGAVPVEKIYLLGSSLLQERTESVFMPDAPSCRKVSHYWLLVLIDDAMNKGCNAVQDIIENTCKSYVPVTAIVLRAAQFNTWLATGHRFAGNVIKIAVALYDNNNSSLVLPDLITGATTTNAKEDNTAEGLNKVTEFMAGAELYRLRNQHAMAAFMLHQAAEHALHTLFKSATGLQINTHNIDKLLRYCAMVHYKIPAIFPREKETDRRLLAILQQAYINARYKDDFSISEKELDTIMQRVAALQELICTS